LRKNKIRFSKINHIFISHLHGDHFLVDRSSVVYIIKSEYRFYIHGPKGIKEIIKLQLRLANSWSNYGLHFHELESNERKLFLRMIKCRSNNTSETPYLHQWFFIRGKIDKRKLNTNAVQNYEIDKCYFKI
jgi:ribonuclease Z